MSGAHRRSGERSRLSLMLAVVIGVVCVPVAAAVVVLLLRDRTDAAERHDRHEALTAARQIVRDVLSYDYRTMDADMARARSETTGVFTQQYSRTSRRLAAEARQLHAIVQAKPRRAGIVDLADGNVVVLLYVDQVSVKQIPDRRAPATQLTESRVRVTLTEVGGEWKAAQLVAL